MQLRLVQPGFTLLETLIALSIAVLVLTTAGAAHHSVQQSILISEQQAQMSTLASQSVQEFRLLKDQSTDMAATFGFGNAASADSVVKGAFIATKGGIGECSTVQCSNIEDGGPAILSWCATTAPCASTAISPVGITGCLPLCRFADIVAAHQGEVVAVRRDPFISGANKMVSLGFDGTFTGGAPTNRFSADDFTIRQSWDLYLRTVTLTKVSPSSSLDFAQTKNGASDASLLRGSLYKITVNVQDYYNPSASYSTSSFAFK